jgi:hypothetical protein
VNLLAKNRLGKVGWLSKRSARAYGLSVTKELVRLLYDRMEKIDLPERTILSLVSGVPGLLPLVSLERSTETKLRPRKTRLLQHRLTRYCSAATKEEVIGREERMAR